MAEVDKTYKHFYNMFSHLDTVKLRILLGIKLNAMTTFRSRSKVTLARWAGTRSRAST